MKRYKVFNHSSPFISKPPIDFPGAEMLDLLIQEIECEKETKTYFVLNGKRIAKETNWYCIFETWENAHLYLIDRATKEIRRGSKTLRSGKRKLNILLKMKAPEEGSHE